MVIRSSLMPFLRLAVALLCSAVALSAQNLPVGTALPVALGSSLNTKSAKPGQKIEGKLMQEVMLSGTKLRSGSHVTGHVVSVSRPGTSGARIVLQFDQLQDDRQTLPLHAGARAVASSQSVFSAGLPVDTNSTDEGSQSWVTKQVGGEYVFRGRGYVSSDQGKVGTWSGSGVWGKLPEVDDCPAGDNSNPQLWMAAFGGCFHPRSTKLERLLSDSRWFSLSLSPTMCVRNRLRLIQQESAGIALTYFALNQSLR
jgi:hypothetical protein